LARFDYQLTNHARQRISERKILISWLESVLFNPQRLENDKSNPDLYRAIGVIPESNNKVLVVVYDTKTSPAKIVTAHFDRRLKGTL
jgi:hypothetical protein